MTAAFVHGEPGNRKLGWRIAPARTRARNRRCVITIIPQTQSTATVATLVMYPNALAGTTTLRRTPMDRTTPDAASAAEGTCRRFTAENRRGACPDPDSEKSIRALVKIPLLQEESAAVRTTTLRMPAAAGIPRLCQARTNGLSLTLVSFQGISIRITRTAPT